MTSGGANPDGALRDTRLRRALHFVPGANEKMLGKALGTAADGLILDLEDAVAPDRKDEARTIVTGWLRDVAFGAKERIVRINPLDTPWGEADLRETMAARPDAYVVPKVRTVGDLHTISEILSGLEAEYGYPPGRVVLIPVSTETAQGALQLQTFPECRRLVAMTWGAEDLSAALGARRNRDEAGEYLDVFKYCRVQTLLSAVAGGVQPIDTVYTDIANLDGLRADCRAAAWMGFTGKISIHPDQIPVINEVFTPSREEAEEALELVGLFDEARAAGRFAFRFKGQMVDAPHLHRAETIVARARQAGVID